MLTVLSYGQDSSRKSIKTHGFTNYTELNYGINNFTPVVPSKHTENIQKVGGENSYGITTIMAYQASPLVSFGIGTGIESTVYPKYIVPVFFNCRIYMSYTRTQPYVEVNMGKAWSVGNSISTDNMKYSIGSLCSPGAGIKIYCGNTTALTFGIAYKYQYIRYNTLGGPYDISLQDINLKMGVAF